MKKMMRTLGILAMVLSMLAAMAMPAMAADYDFERAFSRTQNIIESIHTMIGFVIVLFLLIGIAASVYIFVTAPQCGMSRAWALAPVVGNVFGLIAFIMVRTASKTTVAGNNTVVCPTCNGVHPDGSQFCNICGTKLQ